ncbi:PDR/VanB family oxidoreductase [Mycolicibacterium mengxianglii]|uniref:PDR/VanB family oxidoreductase n=1 Tax=Mycolicibacterium mengxianglii TaxID=2736649 RepID=UPI0018D012FD|nr:PDR/VanB family oxidoreductase [Mycolicibacterium mengxianglii]
MKLQVLQIRLEADQIISMTLRDPHGQRLPEWAPGAHLALTLPSGLVRQYSLCGALDDPHTYTVAILKVGDGRGGSREVHEQLRVGDLIEVAPPRNNFALEPAPHYLFLAGGIGITPIVAMMDALRVSPAGSYQLLYGARNRAAMAFTDRLVATGANTVELVAHDEAGLLDIAGAMAASPPGTRVYCCGPPAMLSAVQEISAGFPDLVVHFERFAAEPQQQPVAPAAGGPFTVELARTGVTVTVTEDQTVLDAVLAVAPETPYSCESGFCGTCETKVLAGEVDHRDTLLTEAEQAANGTMMICVSRSKDGTKLSLDL